MSAASTALTPANLTLRIGNVFCFVPVRRPVSGIRRVVGETYIRFTKDLHTAPEPALLVGERIRLYRDPTTERGNNRSHNYRADGTCVSEGPAGTGTRPPVVDPFHRSQCDPTQRRTVNGNHHTP